MAPGARSLKIITEYGPNGCASTHALFALPSTPIHYFLLLHIPLGGLFPSQMVHFFAVPNAVWAPETVVVNLGVSVPDVTPDAPRIKKRRRVSQTRRSMCQ